MSNDNRKPSVQELREMLDYNPTTGVLRWKTRPGHHFKTAGACKSWNTRWSGGITGCPDKHGYLRINIRGTPYLAHQLIWALVTGEWVATIDHRDTDPSNNRWDNLRECTRPQNQWNQGVRKNNTSGYKGVCWHSQTGKWRAYIVVNWKQRHLGMFDDPATAHDAYRAAADAMHGDFANHGAALTSA